MDGGPGGLSDSRTFRSSKACPRRTLLTPDALVTHDIPLSPLTVLAADKGGLGNGDSTRALEPSFVTSLLPSLPPSTRMVGGRGKAATSVEKTAASSAVSDSASEVTEASEVVVEVETERGRVEDVRRLGMVRW